MPRIEKREEQIADNRRFIEESKRRASITEAAIEASIL